MKCPNASSTTIPSTHAQHEHARRMNRVLDYVDAHLDAELALETLAEVAHFSPYHFHRVFMAWMGETLGDYVRRRRLEVGALQLASDPKLSVLTVALGVGFGSGEAFARAFKKRFAVTPSQWQAQTPTRFLMELAQVRNLRDRNLSQVDGKESQDASVAPRHTAVFDPLFQFDIMKTELVTMKPTRIAYMRHIGPYGEGVGAFWMKTFAPWMAANDLFQYPRYGISHDDPNITPPEKCRYDACVEVPEDFVVKGNAMVTTIPGGRYATVKFRGTGATIGEAWMAMFREWLPQNNLKPDARACFEYYAPDGYYDPKTGTFECDLCVPVTPL